MTIELQDIELLTSDVRLSAIAGHIVDGYLVGMHSATRRGTGGEFSHYRGYQPGDDIRLIDWKKYARSNKYYIKESEIEASATIRFFLDKSASMSYSEFNFSRFRYASTLIAALSLLAYRQDDEFALHIINNNSRDELLPRFGKSHLNELFELLEKSQCSGNWPKKSGWLTDCLQSSRREIWFVFSDMLDGIESWESFSNLANAFGSSVHYVQILGAKEYNLDFRQNETFLDPESGEQQNVRVRALKDEYLKNLRTYQSELRNAVLHKKSRHSLIQMDTPLVDALNICTLNRERL